MNEKKYREVWSLTVIMDGMKPCVFLYDTEEEAWENLYEYTISSTKWMEGNDYPAYLMKHEIIEKFYDSHCDDQEWYVIDKHYIEERVSSEEEK